MNFCIKDFNNLIKPLCYFNDTCIVFISHQIGDLPDSSAVKRMANRQDIKKRGYKCDYYCLII